MGRTLLAELGSAAPDVAIRGLDQVYPGGAYGKGYQFSDLARHPGVVVVPYTKSVMSFFELYRMNVPLFAPSVELLVKWEMKHSVMVRCPYPYPYPYPYPCPYPEPHP